MKLFNYEFKKSKYPIFKIAFWILILCSFVLILYIQKTNAYYFNVNSITPLKPMSLNISFNRDFGDNYFVCFDDLCLTSNYNSQIAHLGNFNFIKSASYNFENKDFFNTKIKNVYFAIPKKSETIENKIKKFDLFISNNYKEYDFDEFKNFEKKEVSILDDNSKEKIDYIIYKFPHSSNYIGLKRHILILSSSLLFNWSAYLIPYLWLLAAVLIFMFNKDAFKISFKKKAVILSCTLLLFILVPLGANFMLLNENKENSYMNFIQNDIKNYSKDYKIHIFSANKNIFENLENENIVFHNFDTKNDKPIIKINKKDYLNDSKKAVIYINSDIANVDMLSINNPRSNIYKTNFGEIVKIVYE